MLREYLIAIGGGASAAAVVAVGIVMVVPNHPAPRKTETKVTIAPQIMPIICKKPQELFMGGKRVCVYDCGQGREKHKIEGVVECLPQVELDPKH